MLSTLELAVPERGQVRVYTAPKAARELGVSTKTLVARVTSPLYPQIVGWPPRSELNPTHAWLVDADLIDGLLATPVDATPGVSSVADDRARLREERQLFEMERAVFERDRLQQLEEDNTRLRSEVERLRAQVSALGLVVQQLTTESL